MLYANLGVSYVGEVDAAFSKADAEKRVSRAKRD